MKAIVKEMVSKAPGPDEIGAYGADDDEAETDKDEDADSAAEMSAMEDYMAAIKSGDAAKALEGFKELSRMCNESYKP